MVRERSPNRNQAKEIYLNAKGDIKLSDLAMQLNIPDSRIRKWKSVDKWDEELKGAFQLTKGSVPIEKDTKKQQKKKKKEPIAKEVEEVIENGDLTEKQRLFCLYYIEDFNATKAYKRAYDCNYDTARAEGCKNLAKPSIKKEIDRLSGECLEEQEIQSKLLNKRLLETYIKIAFTDITDYVSFGRRQIELPDGPRVVNYVDLNESSEVDGTIITEISQGKEGVKVKLADKMRALEFLAKYNGMLSVDVKEKLELERKKVEIAQSKVPSKEQVSLQGQITALADLINNPVEERVLDDD